MIEAYTRENGIRLREKSAFGLEAGEQLDKGNNRDLDSFSCPLPGHS